MDLTNWTIERSRGAAAGRNSGTAFGPFVWAVATAEDKAEDIAGQTRGSLAEIDRILASLGTDRRRMLSATVYMTDIGEKAAMDEVWCAWIGSDPDHWPQRACVQTGLAPHTRVEIVVLAAR